MQQQKTRATTRCANCKAELQIELKLPAAIQNFEHFSLVILEHSGSTNCPSCGKHVIPGIVKIDAIAVGALVVTDAKPAEPSRIVLPGNGRLV